MTSCDLCTKQSSDTPVALPVLLSTDHLIQKSQESSPFKTPRKVTLRVLSRYLLIRIAKDCSSRH